MADEPGTGPNETHAAAKNGEILLSLGRAVAQRGKKGGIEPAHSSQILGVHPVGLALVLVDESKLARIRHEHLVPEVFKESAHPGRVGTGFKHDAQRLACPEASLERRSLVG